jgi:hypothetical protein
MKPGISVTLRNPKRVIGLDDLGGTGVIDPGEQAPAQDLFRFVVFGLIKTGRIAAGGAFEFGHGACQELVLFRKRATNSVARQVRLLEAPCGWRSMIATVGLAARQAWHKTKNIWHKTKNIRSQSMNKRTAKACSRLKMEG